MRLLLIILLSFGGLLSAQQIANYVSNPSFEQALPSTSIYPDNGARAWGPLDSAAGSCYLLRSRLLNTVPIGFGGYQLPRTGNNFIASSFYCDQSSCPNEERWYPRNRLKTKLTAGKTYCVKYFVVPTNNSPLAMQEFGAYLGDKSLDTIKNCVLPITHLIPQIEYQNGLITDTLNWTAISGTFVANGTEKYIVLGNFRSNAATQTLLINPTYLPILAADVLIDDVSVIDVDLPAYAGPNQPFFAGDSVFIGRVPDVGLDEFCTWYQLPNMSVLLTP